jgi:hypothetical protein
MRSDDSDGEDAGELYARLVERNSERRRRVQELLRAVRYEDHDKTLDDPGLDDQEWERRFEDWGRRAESAKRRSIARVGRQREIEAFLARNRALGLEVPAPPSVEEEDEGAWVDAFDSWRVNVVDFMWAKSLKDFKESELYKHYLALTTPESRVKDPVRRSWFMDHGQIRGELGAWSRSVREHYESLAEEPPTTPSSQEAPGPLPGSSLAPSPGSSSGLPPELLEERGAVLDEAEESLPLKWFRSMSRSELPRLERLRPDPRDKDFAEKLATYRSEVAEAFRSAVHALLPSRGVVPDAMRDVVLESGGRILIVVDGQSVFNSTDQSLLSASRILSMFADANAASYVVVVHRDMPRSPGERVHGPLAGREKTCASGSTIYAKVRSTTVRSPGSRPSVCRADDDTEWTHDKCRADDLLMHWFIKTVFDVWGTSHPGVYVVSNNSCYSHQRNTWASDGMRGIPRFLAEVCIGRKQWSRGPSSRFVSGWVKCEEIRGVVNELQKYRSGKPPWIYFSAKDAIRNDFRVVAQ